MKLAEYIFEKDNIVHVIQLKKGQNTKLGKQVMIQTYHFAKDQILNQDISQDGPNCLDCPFSFNQNGGKTGGCYTHKGLQRQGLGRLIEYLNRRYVAGNLETGDINELCDIARNKDVQFVRFGTYGEPVLLPLEMVAKLASLVDKKRWTGYTHQWNKPEFAPYAAYFQASCHNIFEANIVKDMGWRSFVVVPEHIDNAVNCPASKEAGNKTTCSQCSLCNGTSGNSSKDIYILQH